MSHVSKNIYISMLVAQGVILGLIENSLPYPFAFAPGAKLGIANLITLIAIFTMRQRESFLLVCLRLILTALLGGTLSTFFYSTGGALLSYLGMLGTRKLGPQRVSIIGISVMGGFLHNFGQLVVASFFAQSWLPMAYLPFLSVFGILSGMAIGIAANYLLTRVQTLQRFQQHYEQRIQQSWKQ